MATSTPYASAIAQAEQANGIPSGLLSQLIGAESNYTANAFNPQSDAIGIAQIEPATASNPGYGIAPVNPSDPLASISFAGQYLKAMFNKTGSWLGAVQAYGTVPSSGAMNSSQTTLANMATGYDNSGSGITGANYNVASSTGSNLIPASFGGGTGSTSGTQAPTLAPSAGSPLSIGVMPDIAAWASGVTADIAKGFTQAVSGLFAGLENWFTRGFLIFVGIILVAVALWRLLAPDVSPKDVAMAAIA